MNDSLNNGLAYGFHGPARRYKPNQKVRITRGKNKGRVGMVSYETAPAPLSSERRFYVILDTRRNFWAPGHILINESGFYPIPENNQ